METAGQNTKQVMEENDALKQLMELLNQQNCNAALYSRRKKHFIFDSINTITAPSFR